jgi:hypothetical protein
MFKRRKKDNRTYKGFKHWPTAKLKEVIDEPYNRGIDGHDYQPYIEEIKDQYYKRQLKKQLREEKNGKWY